MTGNQLEGTGSVLLADEMAAYDRLGPLSRQALRAARFQIGAASLVRRFMVVGVEADRFKEPAVDRAGARCIRDLDCRLAYERAIMEGLA